MSAEFIHIWRVENKAKSAKYLECQDKEKLGTPVILYFSFRPKKLRKKKQRRTRLAVKTT